MQIPILLEPVANNGYRASSGAPLALTAEGATRDEALAALQKQLQARFQSGAAMVSLEFAGEPHALAKYAGIFSEDDPLVREWLEIMAENRRLADQDPDLP